LGDLGLHTQDLPTMYAAGHDVASYRVREGDLVVAEGGDAGRTGFVPPLKHETIIQNSLHHVRPRNGDVRFLRYSLDAVYASGWLDVLCNRSTFGHLTVEKLASISIPWPLPDQQRAIADYLDAETARIDALIAKKTGLQELLGERHGTLLDAAVADRGVDIHRAVESRNDNLPMNWHIRALGTVLRQLTNGYVGPTRDMLRDTGIPYIQGMHIKNGRIEFERRPFYVDQSWYAARPRIALRAGDVLIVQTGDIGQCAVVPQGFGPASCHALLIARPNLDAVSSDYLGTYLQSKVGHNELLRLSTGALHPHLEFGIRSVPILVPPRAEQDRIISEVTEQARQIELAQNRLNDQIALLRERRQALITAAVTGELDVLATT
jgi:type I restriction enzyme S subunit